MGWGTRSGESMVHLRGFMQYDMGLGNADNSSQSHVTCCVPYYF